MARKNKSKPLPFHLVKNSQNLIQLKLKELLADYNKIPRRIKSSGIIVMGILVFILAAVLLNNSTPQIEKNNNYYSEDNEFKDIIIDENNNFKTQVFEGVDRLLKEEAHFIDLQEENTANSEIVKEEEVVVESAVKVQNTSGSLRASIPEQISPDKLSIIYPLRRRLGTITECDWFFHPVLEKWSFHPGVDLRAQKGGTVMAAAAGKVVSIKEDYNEITLLTIDHGNSWTTTYGQIVQLTVKVGDNVVKGQKLGEVGQSDTSVEPHLHFEIHHGNKVVNPQEYF